MKTDTVQKIIAYIKKHKQITARDMVDYLEISRQALFKHLSKLLADGQIDKIGKPPKVFYFIAQKKADIILDYADINIKMKKIIEENFLIITPIGERKDGWNGFVFWCKKTNQPVAKTAGEYVKTFRKYNTYKKDGLIDGMVKMKSTFSHVYLDKLFYLDFYSIERFGKTKLGQMLLYAKQSQNKILMKKLIIDIKHHIIYVIKKYHIDSVGFIPPTVKREVQFMKELERNLHLDVRKVSIIKLKTEVTVPQKTLNKLPDRVENAKNTIVVNETTKHSNILLIDDAIGSGATLNETAAQIKAKGICKGKVIGLAITGSFKGFDVISEV